LFLGREACQGKSEVGESRGWRLPRKREEENGWLPLRTPERGSTCRRREYYIMRYTKFFGILAACGVAISFVSAQTKTGGGGSHQGSSTTTAQTSGSGGQKAPQPGPTVLINPASNLQPAISPGPSATANPLPNNDPLTGSLATGSPTPTTLTTPFASVPPVAAASASPAASLAPTVSP